MRIYLLLLIGLILFSTGSPQAADPSVEGLKLLTEYLGLSSEDIAFRQDYMEIDPYRLQLNADIMSQPLGMVKYVDDLKMSHVKGQPEIIASLMFQDLKLANQNRRGRAYQADLSEIVRSYNLYYTDVSLNQLLTRAATYIDVVFPRSRKMTLKQLTAKQRKFLAKEFKELLVTHESEEFLSMEAIDSLDQAEMEYAEQFAEFGINIKKDHLLSAGVDCIRELMLEINNLKSLVLSGAINPKEIMGQNTFLPDNISRETILGRQKGWVIGGTSNDYYNGDYKVILDFGGDDVYDLKYDPQNPHSTIIIDLSGNDTYRAKSDFVLGSGCFSVGLLFDLAGDDRYDAQSFGLGSGYFGFGLLYDREGDDSYNGDTHIQGAGTFGIGLLIDEHGRDTYTSASGSQGYAFTEGYGLLFDRQGNDLYSAGGKYKDILRYEDHYYSFAQGFSIGLRPILSGGIGALIDREGNDTYLSDIFAQGSSYWWSLGILADGDGNDRYHSFQYAQGAGTHMTCGILLDDSGNDSYFSKGVSQGCGHDYSCGLLLDRDGDDTYTAFDLSQAAGSANGAGLLIDNSGNDRYFIKNPKNSQGYGNPRRQYGSIGLFIDLGGADQYNGNGKDNYFWKTSSKWGGGMDIELTPPDTSGESK